MKIACILGISQYIQGNDLPACKDDAQLVRDIINATKEYDELLFLATNQSSSKIKQQIVNFLTQFKGKGVDQVFFYYTGHGDFDGKEFYYLLSDFENSKRKQTAIENSELDNWIRILTPELTIKLVDACHAGVQYIKDPELFQKYLISTPKAFKACYFMYSSQKDEYSYQDSRLSYFTKSFAESLANFDGTEMRFKDIIDYISDYFVSIPNQTPFFVTQATNTEIFTAVDDKLRHLISRQLSSYLPTTTSTTTTNSLPVQDQEPKLVEVVKYDAEKYCNKDEVMERMIEIKKFWEQHIFGKEINQLYEFDAAALPSLVGEVPRLKNIGKWLAENINEYFADPTFETEEYLTEIEVPKRRTGIQAFIVSSLLDQEYETKTVTRQRQVVTGYRLTQDMEFFAFRITAEPKFENLKWHDCHVAFVFSKTEVRFFYLFSAFKEINWEERTRKPSENWRMLVAPLKDQTQINDALKHIALEFEYYIVGPIKQRYLASKTDEESSPQNSNDEENE